MPAVKPKVRDDLTVVELDGEAVIYDEETAELHHLNPTATIVFGLCDGTATMAEIAADISEAFGVPIDRGGAAGPGARPAVPQGEAPGRVPATQVRSRPCDRTSGPSDSTLPPTARRRPDTRPRRAASSRRVRRDVPLALLDAPGRRARVPDPARPSVQRRRAVG